MPHVDDIRLNSAICKLTDELLAVRNSEGYWDGHLSSSALSTATALSALALAHNPADAGLCEAAMRWLMEHRNADEGWGDTPDSPSNLSTSLLVQASLKMAGHPLNTKSDQYNPPNIPAALQAVYGADRTFAAPILMNCALAGLTEWQDIPPLPFELAAIPQRWYKTFRLHVVSYALPALIAVGLALDYHQGPRNNYVRMIKRIATPVALARLAAIQPKHGGFLDATPLTAFVAMSMIACFGPWQPVASRCLAFLRSMVREDGSWPIDTDLSIWVTTAALRILHDAGTQQNENMEKTADWVLTQQYQNVHPYTNTAPGGWGWTWRAGGVPDADDTSGAMLALSSVGRRDGLKQGALWLLGMQNTDGGFPTFCRGWGKLPFDRSSPDITAHAIRALHAARDVRGAGAIDRSIQAGLSYLHNSQREDGSWSPLWFGNQACKRHQNPTMGTARVLVALAESIDNGPLRERGINFLVRVQTRDGGWGGDAGAAPTVEETSLAITALARCGGTTVEVEHGISWLVQAVEAGKHHTPSPIGLYFSSLWYSEQLYPVIWALEALKAVRDVRK